MIFTEIDQETQDIDWFFTNSDHVAMVASGGGKLPQSVVKSVENNSLINEFVRSLPNISKVVVSTNLNKLVENVNENYLHDFIRMSQKGFFAFDKSILNDYSHTKYHLVSIPLTPVRLNQFPIEIQKILFESFYNGQMETLGDILDVS